MSGSRSSVASVVGRAVMYDGGVQLRAYERDLSDGLGEAERAVLSRWDGGASIERIARELAVPIAGVERVVQLYHAAPTEAERRSERAWREHCRRAGELHCAAIRRMRANEAVRRGMAELKQMERDRLAAGPRHIVPVELIVERAFTDAEAIFRRIFPNAVQDGHELCVGDMTGTPGKSLRMNIGGGARHGLWADFAGGEYQKGDVVKLVQIAVCGDDPKKAIQWLKAHLGIQDALGDGGMSAADHLKLEQYRIEAAALRKKREEDAAAEKGAVKASARARWLEAKPLTRGDAVSSYLAARAIDLGALAEARAAMGGRARPPGALRYHESLQYGRGVPGGPKPYRGPALVAQVSNLKCEHIATHRIWLGERADPVTGELSWWKAGPELLGHDDKGNPNDPKKVLGSPLGGHILLWKGAAECSLRDIPPGTDVYVSEGIEDGLTAACADPSLFVVAMLSLSILYAMELPPQMGRLVILKQNDAPGSKAAETLAKAVAAHRARGRRVAFMETPAGFKDINDWAMAVAKGEGG